MPTRAERWNLILALLAAIGVRIAYSLVAYCSTFDSAVVGCMAIRILREGERPWFFYGQHYLGSLEAWLAAAIFAVAGIREFTLSLAAMLPALGWVFATWWLVRRWAGQRAAAVAIWPLAVPGWIVLHYSVATYGGYTTAFLLGTIALGLSLKVFDEDPVGRALLPFSLAIATTAGLALWTHFISATYVVPAALLIAARGLRRRVAWCWLWPWLVALPLFAATISPWFIQSDIFELQDVARWTLSRSLIGSNAIALFHRPLRDHLVFPHAPGIHRWTAWWCITLTTVAGLVALAAEREPRQRARRTAPLGVLLIFLAFYLPHPMAALKVPRYVIPFWTIALTWLVALPAASRTPWLRRLGTGLAAAWTIYHGLGIATELPIAAAKRAAHLDDRRNVVAAARSAGLRSATVIGSSLIGHRGSIYTFASECKIAFVNPWDERHRASAEFAEADDHSGFLAERDQIERVRTALRDLGATWSESPAGHHVVLHNVRVSPYTGRGVEAAAMTVKGPDGAPLTSLTDRRLATFLSAPYRDGSGITIELPAEETIEALHLVPPDEHGRDLPRDFTVDISRDGLEWHTVRPSAPRTALAWTDGPRVHLQGYHGHLECRWSAVRARYIRIAMLRPPHVTNTSWAVAELYLRAANAEAAPTQPALEAITGTIRQCSPRPAFVAADRWLSAHLARYADMPKVFPRPNPRYRTAWLDRYLLADDFAVIVAEPWAGDAHEVGTRAGFEVTEIGQAGGYTLLRIRQPQHGPPPEPLYWQGTFLLRADRERLKAETAR